MDMIYYKNKVNGEIYEVDKNYKNHDAFYYVFGRSFKSGFDTFIVSNSKNINITSEDKDSFLEFNSSIFMSYNFTFNTLFISIMNNDNDKIEIHINVDKEKDYTDRELYYLVYYSLLKKGTFLKKYGVKLIRFKFSNTDIFEIVDEDSKEVKDFKVRNYFK